jgi:hypothetical protein
MEFTKEPDKKKFLPKYNRDAGLPEKYKARFEELTDDGLTQTEALAKMSEENGGINVSTIRTYALGQKYRSAGKYHWSIPKRHSDVRQQIRHREAKKNFPTHVEELYMNMPGEDGLTLDQIAGRMKKNTDVRFQIGTIEKLLTNYENTNGHPLLTEIPGIQPPKYQLYKR